MTPTLSTDQLQALLAYPFREREGKQKLVVGSLLTLASFMVPLLPVLLVYGYYARIMRRIIVEGGAPNLPDWEDWGRLLVDGLRLFGVVFLSLLPWLLLFIGGYGLFVAPTLLISFAESGRETIPPIWGLAPVLGMVGGFGSFALAAIGALLTGAVLPPALAHTAARNEFSAAFRIREWWPIFKANLGGFLVSYLLLMGFWFVLSFALQILYFTIILCVLIPLVLSFLSMYMLTIASVLFAQSYATGVQKLSPPPSPQPDAI